MAPTVGKKTKEKTRQATGVIYAEAPGGLLDRVNLSEAPSTLCFHLSCVCSVHTNSLGFAQCQVCVIVLPEIWVLGRMGARPDRCL